MKSTKRIIKFFVALVFVFGIFACVKNTALAEPERKLEFEGYDLLKGLTTSGEGWSYDYSTNTITLNNYIAKDKNGFILDAQYMGKINIKLIGENEMYVRTEGALEALYDTELYFTGPGSLTISAEYVAVTSDKITIDGCTITSVSGSKRGRYVVGLRADNLIINNSVVTAKSNPDTDDQSYGINATYVSITNSTVMASGKRIGIRVYKSLEFGSGATVIADGGSHGIYNYYKDGIIKISKDIKSITATGGEDAIFAESNKIQNEIEGTAWTDIEGKEGKRNISIRDMEIKYQDYKKVVFEKRETETVKPETSVVHTVSTATPKVEEKLDESLKVPTLKSIKKDKKSLTIKWKKITKKIKGYQFQYSTDPNFEKDVKTVNVSNPKTDMRKVKKLKSKTKYYVRIRSFKKVGSEKVYSNWSKTKSAKTK